MTNYHQTFREDTFYHILNHAVGSENLFRTDENYRYFLQKYQHHTNLVWDTYAYCLMPNHFHLLIKTKSINELEKVSNYKGNTHKVVMQSLSNFLNSYAKSYNKKYERKGALFLDFTKRIEIDSDVYFTRVVNYIHQNPIHHGFCKEIDEWEISSYSSCLSEQETKLKREELLNWFGNKEQFEKFNHSMIMPLEPNFEYN